MNCPKSAINSVALEAVPDDVILIVYPGNGTGIAGKTKQTA